MAVDLDYARRVPLIRDVMSTQLVVVEPDLTVAAAATVMGGRHVGAALVMEADSLVGIFTERDVLTALGSDFDAAGHLVSQWMSRKPTTVVPDLDAREALDLMLEAGYRHLPVVEDGKVLGVVSIRDLAPRD
jgi:CBS domain-containing protein